MKRISLEINSNEHCFILYFSPVFFRIVIKLINDAHKLLFDMSLYKINQLKFPLTMFFLTI